jgi:hypothetical protein
MRLLLKPIITCFVILYIAQVFAQDSAHSTFHLGFINPLSTNGKKSGKISNSFSLHFLGGVSKNEENFSIAGLYNFANGSFNGVQVAGLLNYSKQKSNGFLLSGLASITKADYKGIQLSGLYNESNNFNGLQYAGIINYSNNVNGIQLSGLVNIAKNVNGLQIGILNIANNNNYPIGLINIIKRGTKNISINYDYLENTTIQFNSGGKKLYGIIGIGYNNKVNKKVGIIGQGYRLPISKVFKLNNELIFNTILKDFNTESSKILRFNLKPSLSFSKLLSLEIALVVDYLIIKQNDDKILIKENKLGSPSNILNPKQLQVGFMFGISCEL